MEFLLLPAQYALKDPEGKKILIVNLSKVRYFHTNKKKTYSALISTGIAPNKNCLYRIDDMVMTEDQMLEAFGLVGTRKMRAGAQT